MKNHNEYNGGIFDCWYSGNAADLWIEYKFVQIPVRDTTLVVPGLSDLQLDWGRRRASEGRDVAVIVGSEDGGVYLRPDQWAGLTAREFRQQLEPRKALANRIVMITSPPKERRTCEPMKRGSSRLSKQL